MERLQIKSLRESPETQKGRSATGNKAVNIFLTDLDLRILGIIGISYTEGSSEVPDSFPEEVNVKYQRFSNIEML